MINTLIVLTIFILSAFADNLLAENCVVKTKNIELVTKPESFSRAEIVDPSFLFPSYHL